ncbi:MAG TPA: tetratricopeptide repeat protein [Prolixibacteraceae bacterium]|nr:tetratricopeptide repeat protein [Bacteroidales bacterium]HNZ71232.1 tetratricopeptide repeat protein [Prolixibacteraceae bacterium]HPB06489.1 tetratricopeptide repeat protein [Prolixibacteraceae bacterium]HUM88184.1 tetratricopeptide repeat protein [Prolixibacteraceae bacterium]
MVKDTHNKKAESFGEVEVALTKTEQFLEKHLNLVFYVIGGIIVVVLGVLGINKYVISPKNVEAQEQMFAAQNFFSVDSFDVALNGDGVSLGFLDIIDDFGSTKSGKLAQYYAGISFLHLGDYNQAIKHLKKFKTDDLLLAPLAKAAIGDAYVELGNYDKAISAYNDALAVNNNDFTTPTIKLKLALVYEEKGNVEKALVILNEAKSEFPNNSEITAIEKNIARLNQ